MINMILTTDGFNGTVTTFTDVYTELSKRGRRVCLNILYKQPWGTTLNQVLGVRDFTQLVRRFTGCQDVRVLPYSPTIAKKLITAEGDLTMVCRDTLVATLMVHDPPVPNRLMLMYPLLVRAAWGHEPWSLTSFNELLIRHDVVVVGNDVNRRWVTNQVRYMRWRPGFARRRIDVLRTLPVQSTVALSTATYDHHRRYGTLTAFDHLRYLYRRREVGPGLTYENIGKLMFEFLLCGRTVHYSPAGKLMDDGLTEMLARFNVDDDVEQELTIPVDVLENELLDGPFDQLADIIDASQHRRR